MRSRFLPLFALLALLPHLGARADTLTETDGTVLKGDIISESRTAVIFDAHADEFTIRYHFPKSSVQSIHREGAQQGPGYFPIPLEGEFGIDITADAVRQALAKAHEQKADYVVLVINSPGGSINEMFKIIALLQDARDVKVIAYVRRAMSAAAITAMSCPEIYMAKGASLGAAVPWKMGPNGTPVDVETKFRSALAAQCRAAVEIAGHSPLLAQAMIDPDIEIAMIPDGKKPRIVEASSVPTVPLFKRKQSILTLTDTEAITCGLSGGTVASVEQLKDLLGIKNWHKVSEAGVFLMKNRATASRAAYDRGVRQQAYEQQFLPELNAIDQKIKTDVATIVSANQSIAALDGQYKLEADQIELTYRPSQASNTDQTLARQVHDAKIGEAKRRYQPPAQELVEQRNRAQADLDLELARRKQILNNRPE